MDSSKSTTDNFQPNSTSGITDRSLKYLKKPVIRKNCLAEHEGQPHFHSTTTAQKIKNCAENDRPCNSLMTTTNSRSFDPLLTDFDLYLLGEGNHHRLYERLGAHFREVDGIPGVNFAVWAPNAQAISLVGDFNNWSPDEHPMKRHPNCGYWEIFVPGVQAGDLYKYHVTRFDGRSVNKTDPCGFQFELPPRTASIVTQLDVYDWNDKDWMASRKETDQLNQPISIYELHLGSWRQDPEHENGWFNYRILAEKVVKYCLDMGYTHIELLPVSEHPYTGSWGYQTVGYYGATSRYGTPDDFMYFVDHCHRNGIGVIIDWVPAHFPKDDHGLARFDGTALYEHMDPRQGEHPDWGTLIFNYGRVEVQNFLIASALFWFDKFHIDGLRVDAVASMLYLDYSREEGQWIPNKYGGRENLEAIDFLKRFNEVAHQEFPGVLTIAEESTAWGGVSKPTSDGGLGFSMKWNMGWMNDSLRYMRNDPVHRKFHHDQLTFSMVYAFSENFVLPFSHDEVVHGKGSLIDQMPGDLWQKFANLRLLYAYMWTHPGKKLVFMGCEFGQWNEWNCDSELQWDLLEYETHRGVQQLVADLNHLMRAEPALYEQDFHGHGFRWIDCNDKNSSMISYIRFANDEKDFVVICCNFTPITYNEYRLGVPEAGQYVELLNSDDEKFGGSNFCNREPIESDNESLHGFEQSILINVPPLGVTILKWNDSTE